MIYQESEGFRHWVEGCYGLDAKVVYKGATPGLIHGAGQINALIPDDVAPGDAVSLEILIGDNASQPGITLAVGPAQ